MNSSKLCTKWEKILNLKNQRKDFFIWVDLIIADWNGSFEKKS